jgi:hypothetical protein
MRIKEEHSDDAIADLGQVFAPFRPGLAGAFVVL